MPDQVGHDGKEKKHKGDGKENARATLVKMHKDDGKENARATLVKMHKDDDGKKETQRRHLF